MATIKVFDHPHGSKRCGKANLTVWLLSCRIAVWNQPLMKIKSGKAYVSGSPIIQNGKLIGAVTHVLIDDCKRGYAIFAENMLETAQNVAEKQLKKAS